MPVSGIVANCSARKELSEELWGKQAAVVGRAFQGDSLTCVLFSWSTERSTAEQHFSPS